MSKIEDMIREMCPDGVRWVKLGEVGVLYGGLSGKSKKDFENGNAKFITYKNVYANPALNIDVEDKVQINPGEKQNTVQYGDILFTGSSETPDECAMSSVLTTHTDEALYLNSFCFGFRFNSLDGVIPEFYKHYFRCTEMRLRIAKTAHGTTRFNVSKKEFAQLSIPLPPLPIQEKIVEILEKFSLLSAELEAELEGRRKQYDFYRNRLLSFDSETQFELDEGRRQDESSASIVAPSILHQPSINASSKVEWKKIGELFEFKNGLNASKDQFGHGMPIINYVNVYKKNSIYLSDLKGLVELDDKTRARYEVKRGDVFFTRTSETQEEIGFASVLLEDIPNGVFSGFLLRARPKTDLLLPEYCKYCFASYSMRTAIVRSSTMTTRALTNGTILSSLLLPVPSIEEQRKIVCILDKFEALVTDLSAGLPAEIERVQKQYEYYRNKLLTFPEA